MSQLAHSTYGAPGFRVEKLDIDKQIKHEILEAKRIQRELGCSYAEALWIVIKKTKEH